MVLKALKISDSEAMVMALQDEIRRSEQSRYDHRLHGVLLVAQGMTCPQVAALLGEATRTVEYWVRGFERDGLTALVEKERSGRRARLDNAQLEIVAAVLRETPEAAGLAGNLWDGKSLSAFLKGRFGVDLQVRQCQRLFRHLGFRRRKPRPEVAKADPLRQAEHKKNFRP